ncbi:LTA synthase family protein [Vibrio olivae]|uniref:LTA synthase family protein n=1 Tax=Vibrio olivae TaxID=1243002 RepID=A0ABV5HN83_9VIBR
MVTNLLLLSLSRSVLSIWQAERVFADSDYLNIFIGGFRIDLSTVCYAFAPAIVALMVLKLLHVERVVWPLIRIYLVVISVMIAFFEVITPTFILEYDLRPNRLFIDYLLYPKEVLSMLFGGYKTEIIVTLLTLFLYNKIISQILATAENVKWRVGAFLRCGIYFLASISIFLGARGTLEHRPINPAFVAFSTDHLLNDLSINSIYSVGFAWKQLLHEDSSEEYYGALPQETLLKAIYQSQQTQNVMYSYDDAPTKTFHQATYPDRRKNLVILLQESLGARYVGALGGLPLTPNLDQLMESGWNFTNLYATGTRSVRGIEAVITGFTPTPARSVVKLDKSQNNFFTLASFLKQQGYYTQFIYGGESHFDNMKTFFLGNGFSDIVDINSFQKVNFSGSWGASDEDLYDQADYEFTQLASQSKPFFSLVFTSSNHSPYDYPAGKITPYESPNATRNNAAKYSDYALGQFIKKAKQSNYWKDTIFLVVADHDSRVSGADLVPIKHFHIPAVIFGKDVTVKQEDRLASQIDLPPTLLSLIGASGETPMLGNDFTKPLADNQPRALLQYDKNFAYLKQGKAVVFQPNKEPLVFDVNNRVLTPSQADTALIKEAHAYANFGSMAYQKGWYSP